MNWPAFEVRTSNLQGEAGKVRVSRPISLSVPSPRNTTQTRPTLPQRRRSQTEPRPLRAPTMWLHLVIAAGQFKGCNEIKEFFDFKAALSDSFATTISHPFSDLSTPTPTPSVSSYDKNQAYSTEWSDDEQPTAYSGNENGGNGNSFEDDSSTGRGVRVRALYDYEGQEQDELSFKAGNYHRGRRLLSSCRFSPRGSVIRALRFGSHVPELLFKGIYSPSSNLNTHFQVQSSCLNLKVFFEFPLNGIAFII